MIVINEYWNRVVDDETAPLGTKVLRDEYELKSTRTVDTPLNELKKRLRGKSTISIGKDYIREDGGRAYGIHSYRIIKEAS